MSFVPYVGRAETVTRIFEGGLNFAYSVAPDTLTIMLDALQLVDQVSHVTHVILVWHCQTHFSMHTFGKRSGNTRLRSSVVYGHSK